MSLQEQELLKADQRKSQSGEKNCLSETNMHALVVQSLEARLAFNLFSCNSLLFTFAIDIIRNPSL